MAEKMKDMNKVELTKHAKMLGVEVKADMTKAEIIRECTTPKTGPALSETPVIDGQQANGDATPAPEAVTGPPLTEVTEVPSLESRVDALSTAVIAIAGRIDRIVYAISHAKKVKGL